MTARCLSPLSGFETGWGMWEKLPVTWGLGGGIHRVLQFPPPLTTGYPQLSLIMTEKVMIIEIYLVEKMELSLRLVKGTVSWLSWSNTRRRLAWQRVVWVAWYLCTWRMVRYSCEHMGGRGRGSGGGVEQETGAGGGCGWGAGGGSTAFLLCPGLWPIKKIF